MSGDSIAGLRLDDINITKSTGVGISTIAKGKTVVYPNPSTGSIYVNSTINSESFTVSVFNAIGQNVYSKVYSTLSSQMIDLSSQPSGQYMVRVISDKGVNTEVINLTK